MNDEFTKEEFAAQCAAYRHSIKDVVREPDPIKLKENLSRLLADDKVGTLGRDFHFIIKYAVQMVHFAEKGEGDKCREVTEAMFAKVKELEKNATVTGWITA